MIVLSLVAALFCAAGTLVAQDEIPEGAKEAKLEKVDYVSANSIDFRKSLNLPFAGLTTLGARMEVARQSCDPVTLATCGLELKAAEAASGKTAALGSKQVLDEAYNYAFQRSIPAELKAMKVLMPEKAKDLDKVIAVAEEPESSRGFRFIHVRNNADECCIVYINGVKRGEVHAGDCRRIASGSCPHHCMDVEIRAEDCGHLMYRAHVDNVVNTWFVTLN